ncbi:protein of unknown function [Nitrosotalea devaniterrae]|uniref:Uncharacterized protein n=1 Tax=Nitrosotalea devaniterrae TaxID=1078905 RepID=A0A128A3H9_9ARCH|nr:protein of unknown function [Candidatus Nitrosotalea devanaterra]
MLIGIISVMAFIGLDLENENSSLRWKIRYDGTQNRPFPARSMFFKLTMLHFICIDLIEYF